MFVNVAVAILFVSLSYHHGLGEYIIKAYDLYLNKTVSKCVSELLAQTICTEADTCDNCLRRSPDCIWCSQIVSLFV